MTTENSGVRLGDLLTGAGLLKPADLREAMLIAKQQGLPVGRVLIMSAYLTEHQLQAAVRAQSMLKDGLIDQDTVVRALTLVGTEDLNLDDALKSLKWHQEEDAVTNKLGELLLEAEVLSREQLNTALAQCQSIGLPLGRVLVFTSAVSEQMLTASLNAQVLVRDQKITREQAVQGIKAARERQIPIEQYLAENGLMQLPMRDSIRLGELLLSAGLVDEPNLMGAVELGLINEKRIGEILVENGMMQELAVAAALDLQKMVAEGTLNKTDACRALALVNKKNCTVEEAVRLVAPMAPPEQAVSPFAEPHTPAPESEPSSARPEVLPLYQFLQLAGLITAKDIETAVRVGSKDAEIMGRMLVAAGILQPDVVAVAQQSRELIARGILNSEQAIMALKTCHESGITIEEAFTQFNWDQNTLRQVAGATATASGAFIPVTPMPLLAKGVPINMVETTQIEPVAPIPEWDDPATLNETQTAENLPVVETGPSVGVTTSDTTIPVVVREPDGDGNNGSGPLPATTADAQTADPTAHPVSQTADHPVTDGPQPDWLKQLEQDERQIPTSLPSPPPAPAPVAPLTPRLERRRSATPVLPVEPPTPVAEAEVPAMTAEAAASEPAQAVAPPPETPVDTTGWEPVPARAEPEISAWQAPSIASPPVWGEPSLPAEPPAAAPSQWAAAETPAEAWPAAAQTPEQPAAQPQQDLSSWSPPTQPTRQDAAAAWSAPSPPAPAQPQQNNPWSPATEKSSRSWPAAPQADAPAAQTPPLPAWDSPPVQQQQPPEQPQRQAEPPAWQNPQPAIQPETPAWQSAPAPAETPAWQSTPQAQPSAWPSPQPAAQAQPQWQVPEPQPVPSNGQTQSNENLQPVSQWGDAPAAAPAWGAPPQPQQQPPQPQLQHQQQWASPPPSNPVGQAPAASWTAAAPDPSTAAPGGDGQPNSPWGAQPNQDAAQAAPVLSSFWGVADSAQSAQEQQAMQQQAELAPQPVPPATFWGTTDGPKPQQPQVPADEDSSPEEDKPKKRLMDFMPKLGS